MVTSNSRWNYTAAWFVGLVGIFIAAIPFYWSIIQQPPIRNIQLAAIDYFTWQGGVFRLSYFYDGEISCPHYTIYSVRTSDGTLYQDVSDIVRKPGLYEVTVPKDVSAGPLYYNETIYMKCNPIKEFIVSSPEVKVQVIK